VGDVGGFTEPGHHNRFAATLFPGQVCPLVREIRLGRFGLASVAARALLGHNRFAALPEKSQIPAIADIWPLPITGTDKLAWNRLHYRALRRLTRSTPCRGTISILAMTLHHHTFPARCFRNDFRDITPGRWTPDGRHLGTTGTSLGSRSASVVVGHAKDPDCRRRALGGA